MEGPHKEAQMFRAAWVIGMAVLLGAQPARADRLADRETVLCVRNSPFDIKGMTEILLGFRLGPMQSGVRHLQVIFARTLLQQLFGDIEHNYDATDGRIKEQNIAYDWPDPCTVSARQIHCDLQRYPIENQPITPQQKIAIPLNWRSNKRLIENFYDQQNYTCERYVDPKVYD